MALGELNLSTTRHTYTKAKFAHSLNCILSYSVKMDCHSLAIKITFVVAMAFGFAGLTAAQDTGGLQITLEKNLKTFETELSVIDQSGTRTLSSSCSEHLNIPSLNTSVTADVDDNGSGTLKIGDVVYNIHENTGVSGGISCNRLYSDEQVFVICDLLSTDAGSLASLARLRRRNTRQEDCFTSRKRNMSETRSLKDHAMVMINGGVVAEEPHSARYTTSGNDIRIAKPMDKRQGACGTWTATTKAVSNPDPHQNYYLKQLSVSSDTCFCSDHLLD